MVDVENMVIDLVQKALTSGGYNIDVTSTYDPSPSSFPAVAVYEEENHTYRRSQDEALTEHHAEVMYTVNVYSNKKSGAKQQAKKIFSVVDGALQNIRFTRTTTIPDANADKTIYRIVARYEAVIEEPKTIDGKKVYQVYRG